MDDEINIFNALKTKHKNTTRPIQNIVPNPRQPPVMVNKTQKNHYDFHRLKTVPEEISCSNIAWDDKGKENNIIIFKESIANFDRNTNAKINNTIWCGRVRFWNFPGLNIGRTSVLYWSNSDRRKLSQSYGAHWYQWYYFQW